MLGEGGMKLKTKNSPLFLSFGVFVTGGRQWWPLNVSVGWGERMNLYERGQHKNKKWASKCLKNTTTSQFLLLQWW